MTAPMEDDNAPHHRQVPAMAVIASGSADDANDDTPVISSRCIVPIEEDSVGFLPNEMAEAVVVYRDEQDDEERGGSVVTEVIASSIIGGGTRDANNGNGVRSAAACAARRREAALVSATILLTEPKQNAALGITFKDQDGKVVISSLPVDTSEDGTPFLLRHSPFKVGDEILSINGTKICAGMGTSSVVPLLLQLRQEPGMLTILARRPTGDSSLVETMIEKPSRDSVMGVTMKRNDWGILQVSKVARGGLFAHSLLNVGDTVLAVNQVDCQGMDATSTVEIMVKADRYVTVMTKTRHTTGVVVAVGDAATAQEDEPNIPAAMAATRATRTKVPSPQSVASLRRKEERRNLLIAFCILVVLLIVCNLHVRLRQDDDDDDNQ